MFSWRGLALQTIAATVYVYAQIVQGAVVSIIGREIEYVAMQDR